VIENLLAQSATHAVIAIEPTLAASGYGEHHSMDNAT